MRSGKTPEDREIHEKLLVWEYFRFATEGVFVEVGANDPKHLSQTWLLEKVGWRGVLVEPLPDKAEALRRDRPSSRVFEVAVSSPDRVGEADFHVFGTFSSLEKNVVDNQIPFDSSIRVRVVTLEEVLREANVDRLDFLSIDTEGTELDVLKGFDPARYRPALLLIEDHVHSLNIHRHMKTNGYRLIRRTGYNNWYAPDSSRHVTPMLERLRLFRKVYLGTPLRAYKFEREKRKKPRG
jgi:FkbM family methyltransferase